MNNSVYDLRNHLWSELQVEDEALIHYTVTARIVSFSHISGNLNPNHMPHQDVAQEEDEHTAAYVVAIEVCADADDQQNVILAPIQ